MISVKNLKKTYFLGGEEVHALDDVSLSIKEHEFVAIIGQSGSGKSTFMNMLGCLDRPDSGEITLDGTDILKCKEKDWIYLSTVPSATKTLRTGECRTSADLSGNADKEAKRKSSKGIKSSWFGKTNEPQT